MGSRSCGRFPGLCPVGFTEPGVGLQWGWGGGGRGGLGNTHFKGRNCLSPDCKAAQELKAELFLSFNRERKMLARSSCYFSRGDTFFIGVPKGIQNQACSGKQRMRRPLHSSFEFLCDRKFCCLVSHRRRSGGEVALGAQPHLICSASATDAYPVKATTGC